MRARVSEVRVIPRGAFLQHPPNIVEVICHEDVEKIERNAFRGRRCLAAIRNNPSARHNLALYEEMNGTIERAVKHFIIAANLGFDKSTQSLRRSYYTKGRVTKVDLGLFVHTRLL